MISIIMPAYNAAKYISASIESVLRQTYSRFELIIINDGSVDETENIIKRYLFDNRVRLINQDNMGVSRTRNKGIEKSKGEFVCFLDSDDFYDENFLQSMINGIQGGKVGLFYSIPASINFNGEIIYDIGYVKKGRINAFVNKHHEFCPPFDMNSFIVKKEILEKYNIFFDEDLVISEDIAFFMKILMVTCADGMPEALTYYRRHIGSATTRQWNPRIWEGTVILFDKVYPWVTKYYPEFEREFQMMIDYRTYRFILSVIKNGRYDESAEYIKRWGGRLIRFIHGDGKLNDRIKCWMILKKNINLIKVIKHV